MILLQPDVKKKVILILSGKTASWKYVRIGLKREICTVDKILRYGELFQKFVVFGGYKHYQLRQYYTLKLLSLQRINLDYFHLRENNLPYFYFHLQWILE